MVTIIFLLIVISSQGCITNVSTTELGAGAIESSLDHLASKVSDLSNKLEEQQKAMIEFYAKVTSKLDEHTELYGRLLKKRKAKEPSNNSSSTESSSLLITPPAPSKSLSMPDWSYSEPDTWLSSYPKCVGENQSPINLHTVDVAVRDHEVPINYSSYDKVNKDTSKLVNDGNTVKLIFTSSTSSNPILTGGPFNSTEYYFTHAAFHWGSDDKKGSEHTIRDTAYPLEMQLVHQTSVKRESNLAITSFLFEISQEDNPFLTALIDGLSAVKTAGTEAKLEVSVDSLTDTNNLDENMQKAFDSFSLDLLIQDAISGPYFTYSGSLTYPPCTEVKQFVVFRVPLDISTTQMEKFRLLLNKNGSRMINNFRRVQSVGERILAFTVL